MGSSGFSRHLAGAVSALFVSTAATGAVIEWAAPTAGSFQVGSNWVGGNPPGGADGALFDRNTNPYTVAFSADATNASAAIRQGNVTLALDGNSYTTTGALTVGNRSATSGSLRVENGTLSNQFVTIGAVPSADGAMVVDAVTWNSDGIVIGAENSGNVFATNSSTVTTVATRVAPKAGVISELNISGAAWTNAGTAALGDISLDIGGHGQGVVVVQNGATLVNQTSTRMADGIDGEGTMLVTGSGTIFDNTGALLIGLNGDGSMVVRDGAEVRTGSNVFASTSVGGSSTGTGRLLIDDSGQFSTEGLVVYGNSEVAVANNGSRLQSAGDVSVSGDNARLDVGDHASMQVLAPVSPTGFDQGGSLFVGGPGAGETSTLTVSFDATLDIANNLVIAGGLFPYAPASRGVVDVNEATIGDTRVTVGGAVHVGGYTYDLFGTPFQEDGGIAELNVDDGAFVDVQGGLMRIHSGGTVSTGSGSIVVGRAPEQAAGVLRIANDGAVYSIGTINAHILNTGLLHPGLSPGDMQVNGDVDMVADLTGVVDNSDTSGRAGRLILEIGGTDPADYSQLTVNGTFYAGGVLELLFIDEFLPSLDDVFADLISATTFAGSFDEIVVSGIQPGWQYQIVGTPGTSLGIRSLSDGLALVPAPAPLALLALGLLVLRGRASPGRITALSRDSSPCLRRSRPPVGHRSDLGGDRGGPGATV